MYIYISKSTRAKGRPASDDPFPRRSSTTSNWSSDPDSVWEEGSGREDHFTARTVPHFAKLSSTVYVIHDIQ